MNIFLWYIFGINKLLDFCANPPGPATKINFDKITLPETYYVGGGITNWVTPGPGALTETATKDYRVLTKYSEQEKYTFIQELTGEQQSYYVNDTDNKCTKNAPKPHILKDSRFESILGNDTSSLDSILNGIIQLFKTNGGFIKDDSSVEGTENRTLIACIDGAAPWNNKVVVELLYLYEPIRTGPYSRQLLISMRMIEVANYYSVGAVSHVSFDFAKQYPPTGDKSFIQDKLSCTARQSALPIKPVDEFAGVFNYFDNVKNKKSVLEILYSKSRQYFIIASDSFNDKEVQLLQKQYPNGTDYIAHDFKYHYEFTMKNGECDAFNELDNSTKDISFVNKVYRMAGLESMILDPTLQFDIYENHVDQQGRSLKVYRADHTDLTYEVKLNDAHSIHSMSVYRKNELLSTLTITPTPIEESKLHLKLEHMFDCYEPGKKFAGNNLLPPLEIRTATGEKGGEMMNILTN